MKRDSHAAHKTGKMLQAPLASRLIRRHEGVRAHPYTDSVGKLTIGVGRNLSDRGLSVPEINFLYENDYQIACAILDIWAEGWTDWPLGPRLALISMAYNLGGPRLNSFARMRAALLASDFEAAAREALDSKWASQTGRRSIEIAALIRGDLSVLQDS